MKSYITLMTKDSYLPFTVALWDSWKKVESKYPFVVAIDNQITEGCKNKMKELGIDYILIDTSDVDELVSKSKVQGNWREALKKLSIFKLYQYEKLVFLDGDTYMLKNMDSLFDMPVFTTTGRYNTYHPETVTTILGGLFVFEPNEKDYQAILNLIDDVVENRSDNKKFSVEKFNDEHCLSYIYKDRLNMLGCEWQYMPHEFNIRDIGWNELYLYHSGRAKGKWLGKRSFSTNDIKYPLSDYDKATIIWYCNMLDDINEKYKLGYTPQEKTDPVDPSTVELRIPVRKQRKKKQQKENLDKETDQVIDLW